MRSNNILRLLLIGIIVVQPWFWQSIQINFLIAIVVIVLGLFLSYQKKWTVVLLTILTISLFTWQILEYKDDSLFQINNDDIQILNKERSAFPQTLGQFFVNKPVFIIQNLERNFSYNLDLNLYFFINHPRERVGIIEQSRLWVMLLPFFLLGIYFSIRNKQNWLFLYIFFGLIVETFIDPSSPLGPILVFAPFSLLIATGLYLTALKIIKLKK